MLKSVFVTITIPMLTKPELSLPGIWQCPGVVISTSKGIKQQDIHKLLMDPLGGHPTISVRKEALTDKLDKCEKSSSTGTMNSH